MTVRILTGHVLVELNPTYAAMAEQRIRDEAPLLVDVALEAEA